MSKKIFLQISIICCVQFFGLLALQDRVRDPIKLKASVTPIKKKALIFGVTGQDGSYLAEFLLDKGYEVHGVMRRTSLGNSTGRIDHISNDPDKADNFMLHYGDVTDSSNVFTLMSTIQPDEVYNLSAQSHVAISFEEPEYTGEVDALGTTRILEAIRLLGLKDKTKFYQASTSELYGKVQEIPQKESTPFYPRSPYGVAKLYSYWITINYREAYGIFACNGILFNHESPRRGENFVTRKITLAAAEWAAGYKKILYLGNLDSSRDWGFAGDYIEAMWLMLQHDKPDDFVIATGETHTVREFVEKAYAAIGIDIEWRGEGLDETGYDKKSGEVLVKVDSRYFRPSEVDYLVGDATKAHLVLGWSPKMKFAELAQLMVTEDQKRYADRCKNRVCNHKDGE